MPAIQVPNRSISTAVPALRARSAGTRRRSSARRCSRSRPRSPARRRPRLGHRRPRNVPARCRARPGAGRRARCTRSRRVRPASFAATQRVASPDEAARLVELDAEAEPGLVRRRLGRDVRAPDPVALLQPQALDRPVAAGDQPVRLARRPQRAPTAPAPYSLDAYSSQPSSPTNVTRSARTGTSPTVISCEVMNGNAVVAQVGRREAGQDRRARAAPTARSRRTAPVTSSIRTSRAAARGPACAARPGRASRTRCR